MTMATGSSRLPFDPLRDIHWKRSVQIWKRFVKKLAELFQRLWQWLIIEKNDPVRQFARRVLPNSVLLPKHIKPSEYGSIPPATAIRAERVSKGIQHVGLVVGRGVVIHVRKHDKRENCLSCKAAKDSAHSRWQEKPKEPRGKGGKGRVVVTCVSCFAKGDQVVEIPFGSEHGVSAAFRTMFHRGGKSYWRSSDPPEKVLDRAHILLVNGLPGKYNLMHLNCDMFVYYCKTGRWPKKSFQAREGWRFFRCGCSFGGLSRWWPALVCVSIYILLVYLGFLPGLAFMLLTVIFIPVLLTYEFFHTSFCRCYSCFKEMRTSSKEPILKTRDRIWNNLSMFV